MKTTVIFLCSLCLASYRLVRANDPEEPPAKCFVKMGVTLAEIPHLLQDQSAEGIRRRGCVEHCYLEKMGFMTGNSISIENIDAQIDKILENSDNKDSMREAVHQCAADAADDDECMVAEKFAKCGFEHLRLGVQNMLQPSNT
ncbi:uncharacterized protein LOC143376257 [Andrena cerasifolii]|uniref:uncharacterized protein LOC143376257 n=1 Tax=Andrena cerasifolii TaxID=2819439 RepID=UPI0040381D92